MEQIKISIANGWMPDLSLENIAKNNGLYKAHNILPAREGYVPILDKTEYNGTALNDKILNGTYTRDYEGQYYNFAGTFSKLYKYTRTTLEDVTRASGDYVCSGWQFAQYGDWLVATNFLDDMQVLKDFDSGTFAALGGSPPKAKFLILAGSHLVAAYLDESGTISSKKIAWCAAEDVEDWTPSSITGAGAQDFPALSGNITGLGSLGRDFVVAAENSLTIGRYSGGVFTYNFEINAINNIGCYFPNTFISLGDRVFFWSKYSIYSFDGRQCTEIGQFIKDDIFTDNLTLYGESIRVAEDKEKGLILWCYPSASSTGAADKLLIYDVYNKRFTTADMTCDSIFMGAAPELQLDDLETTLTDSLDLLTDSDYWYASKIRPMIGATDYKINYLGGSALTAEIETGEFGSYPARISVRKAKLPIIGSGAAATVTVKHRYSQLESQSSATSRTMKSDGSVDLRASDRYLALNFTASGFTKITTDIDLKYLVSGRR